MKLPQVYVNAMERLDKEMFVIAADAWRDWNNYINAPPGTIFRFDKIPSVIQIAPLTRPVALWETY